MANAPKREIERDLLDYQQHRREQAGPPIELHPATRKMLQSEAARTASRLLLAPAAAESFVPPFVKMLGFFARHRQRILWGSALFACLTVVLAVLRNDPRQTEQLHLSTDRGIVTLPASGPPQTQPRPVVVVNQPTSDADTATRKPSASATATAPMPAVQRETLDRRSVEAATPSRTESPFASNERGTRAPTPVSGPVAAKSESASSRVLTLETDRKPAGKPAAGEGTQLAKALKATEAHEAMSASGAKQVTGESQFKPNDELKRARLTAGVGVPGGAVTEVAPVRQQFLQLDNRVGYRQNFNSPPVPQVMQDFAFERTGDRVRIVDADGSTYVGAVMSVPTEEGRTKGAIKLDVADKRKDAAEQSAQANEPAAAYRFYANGVNRKLNQSVEFRGEWLPAVPAQASLALPALQPASLGVRLERQAVEKKDRATPTNALFDSLAPAQNSLSQQSQKEQSIGRISGRALVGGKSEFDIQAVPK